jgi:hypothetical protein
MLAKLKQVNKRHKARRTEEREKPERARERAPLVMATLRAMF